MKQSHSSMSLLAFCILAFLSTTPLWATDRPLPATLESQKTFNLHTFQTVVQPELRKIILDYQSFIRDLAPEVPEMGPLQDDLLDLKSLWQNWLLGCSKEYSDECAQNLLPLWSLHKKIEAKALPFANTNFIGNMDHSNMRNWRSHLERGIELISSTDSLADLAGQSLTQLEWAISIYHKQMAPPLKLFLTVQHMADQMFVQWEVAHVNLSSSEHRNDFRILYAQFIRPLTMMERDPGRFQLFFQQLDELNFSINYFHRILTKPHTPWPEQTEQKIERMKENWNQILRQIYHRN